jgi:DNA-binding protein HU-beta
MELVEALASKIEMSKADADRALHALVEIITSELKRGGEIAISGFGTFLVRNRAARAGINPKTGQKIQIAATKTPKFRAGKGLKDAVK